MDELPTEPTPGPTLFGGDDEEDVCRVCRVEGDEDEPLIHPCKCSGSVRFVHPGCLKDWLAHSQKRYCEICGYQFAFTKVYPERLPSVIPFTVYVRQTLLWLYRQAVFFVRLWMSVLAWLVCLPCMALLSLRTTLPLADLMPSRLSGVTRDPVTLINETLADANATASSHNGTSVFVSLNVTSTAHSVRRFAVHPAGETWKAFHSSWQNWLRGESGTFFGFLLRAQLLTILVLFISASLFFTREHIIQFQFAHHVPVTDPESTESADDIDPDRYVVRNGVAMSKLEYMVQREKRRRQRTDRFRKAEEERTRKARERYLAEHPEDAPLLEAGDRYSKFFKETWAARREMLKRREAVAASDVAEEVKEEETITDPEAGPSTLPSPRPLPPGSPLRNEVSLEDGEGEDENDWEDDPEDVRLDMREMIRQASLAPPQRPPVVSPGKDLAYWAPEMLGGQVNGSSNVNFPTGRIEGETAGERIADVPQGVEDDPGEEGPEVRSDLGETETGPDPAPKSEDAATGDDDILKANPPSASPAMQTQGSKFVENDDPSPVIDQDASMSTGETLVTSTSTSNSTVESSAPDEVDPEGDIVDLNGDALSDAETVDEEADGGEAVDPARLVIEPNPNPNPFGPARRPPAVDDGPPMDDEEEAIFDGEGWDGALQWLGIVGPIGEFLQGFGLGIAFITAGVTVFVALPITFGTAFLKLDCPGMIVDYFRMVKDGLVVMIDPLVDFGKEISTILALPRLAEPVYDRFAAVDWSQPAVMQFVPPPLLLLRRLHSSGRLAQWAEDLSPYLDTWRRSPELLHRAVESLVESKAISARVGCALIGYGVLAAGTLCVAFADRLSKARIPLLAAKIGRENAVYIKLAIFLVLEFTGFAITIGMLLDFCLMPLWEDSGVSKRWDMLRERTPGTLLMWWLLGHGFLGMFLNSILHIRDRCRPGSFAWLRDPGDPTYSLVKEIMDRSWQWQTRKLVSSLISYSVVISIVVGFPVWSLWYQPFLPILPLRLKGLPPLSSVPFDLVALHLLVPQTLASLRPTTRARRLFGMYWRKAVPLFSLSPLIARRPSHPLLKLTEAPITYPHTFSPAITSPPLPDWLFAIFSPLTRLLSGSYDSTVHLARVPTSNDMPGIDDLSLRKGGLLIPLDSTRGSPKTRDGMIKLLRQDKAARDAKRDPKAEFKVVEMPGYWFTRVQVLVALTLGLAGWIVAGLTAACLLAGRGLMGYVRGGEVAKRTHDTYSLAAGFYVLYASFSIGRVVAKRVHAAFRAPHIRQSHFSRRAKRAVITFLARVYTLLALFLVLPGLVGCVWEVYVGMPGRDGLRGGRAVLHFWDAWAMGCVLDSIFVFVMSVVIRRRGTFTHTPLGTVPGHRLERIQEFLKRPTKVRFYALNAALLPVLGWLVVLLLAPAVGAAGIALLSTVYTSRAQDHAVILCVAYPLTLVVFLAFALRRSMLRAAKAVRQKVIDAEYVVEERVENYDPNREKKEDGAADGMLALGSGQGDVRVEVEVEVLVDGEGEVEAVQIGQVEEVEVEAGAEADREEVVHVDHEGEGGDGGGHNDEDEDEDEDEEAGESEVMDEEEEEEEGGSESEEVEARNE